MGAIHVEKGSHRQILHAREPLLKTKHVAQ
jgi:hypothetical protein